MPVRGDSVLIFIPSGEFARRLVVAELAALFPEGRFTAGDGQCAVRRGEGLSGARGEYIPTKIVATYSPPATPLLPLSLRDCPDSVRFLQPRAYCSSGMGDHLFNDVGIARDSEIETPVAVDSRLPQARRCVIFLGAEGRMQ